MRDYINNTVLWLGKNLGTPGFLILSQTFVATYMAISVLMGPRSPDPYPFILLNLMISEFSFALWPIMLMRQLLLEEMQQAQDAKMSQTIDNIYAVVQLLVRRMEKDAEKDDTMIALMREIKFYQTTEQKEQE